MNTCGSTAITRASEFWKVCRYEAIGELDEDVEDYDAALISLPAEINGKKVFGVEDGQYIVGGELARRTCQIKCPLQCCQVGTHATIISQGKSTPIGLTSSCSARRWLIRMMGA